ncbi:MAG: SIR2 family protein [Chloroflexi bacterium]|nr:SIR2 family protein [Chloroflexota bacterium]
MFPFFDAASVSSDDLPPRWSRLWTLHGSLGWAISKGIVVRSGGREATELIYPDHLKYERVTRLPYSALFERLRKFLMTPDTLLLCSGFSFRDSHICAILDEALAANSHAAILAIQYGPLESESEARQLASTRPNMSVYARDGAVISGIPGSWRCGEAPSEYWEDIRSTFWRPHTDDTLGEFVLGDFAEFCRFLALTRAQQVTSTESGSPPTTEASLNVVDSRPDAEA